MRPERRESLGPRPCVHDEGLKGGWRRGGGAEGMAVQRNRRHGLTAGTVSLLVAAAGVARLGPTQCMRQSERGRVGEGLGLA